LSGREARHDVNVSLWPDFSRPNGFDPILTTSWVWRHLGSRRHMITATRALAHYAVHPHEGSYDVIFSVWAASTIPNGIDP
jgi:hypothetical protein